MPENADPAARPALSPETEGAPSLTTTPHGPGVPCRPRLVILILLFLLFSLLGSWVVLRLVLGSQSSPFRISSSYRTPTDRDTATFSPLFTTNCTLGKSPHFAFATSRSELVYPFSIEHH